MLYDLELIWDLGLGSAFKSYLLKWTIKYCPDAAIMILFSKKVNKWNFMIFYDFSKIQWLFYWFMTKE